MLVLGRLLSWERANSGPVVVLVVVVVVVVVTLASLLLMALSLFRLLAVSLALSPVELAVHFRSNFDWMRPKGSSTLK